MVLDVVVKTTAGRQRKMFNETSSCFQTECSTTSKRFVFVSLSLIRCQSNTGTHYTRRRVTEDFSTRSLVLQPQSLMNKSELAPILNSVCERNEINRTNMDSQVSSA